MNISLSDNFFALKNTKQKKRWMQLWAWQEVWNDLFAQEPIIKNSLDIENRIQEIESKIEELEESKKELKWERDQLLLKALDLYPNDKDYKTFLYWSFRAGTIVRNTDIHPIILPYTNTCRECGESENFQMSFTSWSSIDAICCDNTPHKRVKCKCERELERQYLERKERIEQLKTMPYKEYLQTEEWQSIRIKALKRFGFKCHVCNSTKKLNVHHKTYENRGNENLNDLIVLCEDCHAKYHDKFNGENHND